MKKLLVNINIIDETDKYWHDPIKNEVISFDEKESIHECIANYLSDLHYITLTYKGKPQGNVHWDTIKGEARIVGYHYRGKSDMEAEGIWRTSYWTIWVSIYEVIDYNGFEELN